MYRCTEVCFLDELVKEYRTVIRKIAWLLNILFCFKTIQLNMFKASSLKQIHYFVCLLNILISKKLSKLSLKLMYVYIVFCFLSPEKKCLMSYVSTCKKIICCALLMVHCEWKPSEPADFTNYSWLKPSPTRTLC